MKLLLATLGLLALLLAITPLLDRSHELRPYPLLAQLSRHLFGVRLRTF